MWLEARLSAISAGALVRHIQTISHSSHGIVLAKASREKSISPGFGTSIVYAREGYKNNENNQKSEVQGCKDRRSKIHTLGF